jgi:ATP-dependent Clp protease ATP-binding subunit ClpA
MMTMIRRLSSDARKMVLTSAAQEARRRGDRRLGTDHLLLGLLHDTGSPVARALGVDLEAARTASDSLDRIALESVGVHVADLGNPAPVTSGRRLLPLTSGARAVLKRAVEQTRRDSSPHIETRDFLLALLDRDRPDPAAELLSALGVDGSHVRSRLDGSE